jgi:hypothetical protein
MSYISSFETLDKEIRKAGGKPVVLQALWDGDTSGWYLYLSLYTENPSISRDLVWNSMGTISHGSDLRLFVGGGWTEADLAKELGAKAVEKYGLEFYFPSPDNPDDSCPDWKERETAISCTDCGKLMIPDPNSVLPKEICYNCYLERESKQEIIDDKPQEYGVNQYRCKGRSYQNMSYRGYMKQFPMFPYISDKLKQQISEEGVVVLSLKKDELLNISQQLEAHLDVLVKDYKQAPPVNPYSKQSAMVRQLSYKGKSYQLDRHADRKHEQLTDLISDYNSIQEAIREGASFKFFIKTKGYTYRDDSILHFMNNENKGRASIDSICQNYEKILSREQVLASLQKLERYGCLKINGEDVSVTSTGKYLF